MQLPSGKKCFVLNARRDQDGELEPVLCFVDRCVVSSVMLKCSAAGRTLLELLDQMPLAPQSRETIDVDGR